MSLTHTGERFMPGDSSAETHVEHLHRYSMAARLVGGRVLDVGCGVGYGSMLLAASAAHVVGIDNSPEAVAFADRRFTAPNLRYAIGDARMLPFRNAAFDWAVCFEFIEHVHESDAVLSEIVRALTPDGRILISTPNRPV